VRACIIKYYARGVVTVVMVMVIMITITITTINSSSTPHHVLNSS
jgi:hypothetical protein